MSQNEYRVKIKQRPLNSAQRVSTTRMTILAVCMQLLLTLEGGEICLAKYQYLTISTYNRLLIQLCAQTFNRFVVLCGQPRIHNYHVPYELYRDVHWTILRDSR